MIFIKINQCSVIRYGINHDFSFKELFDWNWKIGKDEDIGIHLSVGPLSDIQNFKSEKWSKLKDFFRNIFIK